MRKIRRPFLILFVIVCVSFSAACSGGEEAQHEWETEWRHTAETHWHFCKNEGCGEKGDEAPHAWVLSEYAKEPTCYTRGEAIYVCSVCGETKHSVAEATGAHVFGGEWQNRAGADVHFRTCTVSGCRAEETEPHETEEIVSAGSLYEDGAVRQVCKKCGAVVSERITPAAGVPVSFEIAVTKGSGYSAGDPAPAADGSGKLLLAQETAETVYAVQISFKNALNGAGGRVSAVEDWSASAQRGVRAFLVDAYTGGSRELTFEDTTPIQYFSRVLRVKIAGEYCIKFVYYLGNEAKATETLYLLCLPYNEWKQSVSAG